MRIIFLSWRDSSHPDGGGSEVYVEEVAAGLARRGHDVTVLCPRHAGLQSRTTRRGFTLLPRGGRLTVYLHGLVHLLSPEGRRYDAVVDVVNGLPFFSALVRRRGLVALVHHIHQEQWRMIYPGAGGRLGWWVESSLFPRLYRRVPMVTVSRASRDDLVALGFPAARVQVVHNGTPPLPTPRAPLSPAPMLSVLARLVPHKRIELAVDAVAELADEWPDLRLQLLGEGWWHEQVEQHVHRRGVTDRVAFRGWVSEQEKADALAASWVMVLPSVKEGWGISVLEAAAVGTPTVAYRGAGGTNESVLDGTTGLLVDDEAELVEAVRRLLGDSELRRRMSQAARAHAATFTWADTVESFERLLPETGRERVTRRR